MSSLPRATARSNFSTCAAVPIFGTAAFLQPCVPGNAKMEKASAVWGRLCFSVNIRYKLPVLYLHKGIKFCYFPVETEKIFGLHERVCIVKNVYAAREIVKCPLVVDKPENPGENGHCATEKSRENGYNLTAEVSEFRRLSMITCSFVWVPTIHILRCVKLCTFPKIQEYAFFELKSAASCGKIILFLIVWVAMRKGETFGLCLSGRSK